jgi:hypothetical protein
VSTPARFTPPACAPPEHHPALAPARADLLCETGLQNANLDRRATERGLRAGGGGSPNRCGAAPRGCGDSAHRPSTQRARAEPPRARGETPRPGAETRERAPDRPERVRCRRARERKRRKRERSGSRRTLEGPSHGPSRGPFAVHRGPSPLFFSPCTPLIPPSLSPPHRRRRRRCADRPDPAALFRNRACDILHEPGGPLREGWSFEDSSSWGGPRREAVVGRPRRGRRLRCLSSTTRFS